MSQESPPSFSTESRSPTYLELVRLGSKDSKTRRQAKQEQDAVSQSFLHELISSDYVHVPARDICVEFVTDPDRGPDFDRHHQQLNIAQKVTGAIESPSDANIQALTEDVKDRGGFLLEYDGIGAERIRDSIDRTKPEEGGWVMVEGSGCPVEKTTGLAGTRIVGGDGHFWVPPDREIDLGDLPVPTGQDPVFGGERVIEEILNDPACAVLIADICSVSHNMGFASAIEHTALEQISHLNNARIHRLKYALAAIASVRGMKNQQGEPVHEELDLDLLNVASVILHTRGQISGKFLGIQMNRTVPASLPDGTPVSLLVDWYITAQKLEGIRPRKNVRVVNGLFEESA